MSVMHTYDVTIQTLDDHGMVASENTLTAYCCYDVLDALRIAATDTRLSLPEYFSLKMAAIVAGKVPYLSTVYYFDYMP